MKTTIILIKYNNPKVEVPCIKSILEYTKSSYTLVVYDNYPNNMNLGKLWNRLIKESHSKFICLLNSDTIVSPNWLEKLVEVFYKEPRVGVIGPITDSSRNNQSKIKLEEDYSIVDFSEFKPEVLSGFCLVFPKKIWKEVNGFPEDYGFYGQEVNFIDKILYKGYRQMCRKDVFVHHEGQATVKREIQAGRFNETEERRVARQRRKYAIQDI